jgi:EmrB/QacA subfamily drug resistance transporter
MDPEQAKWHKRRWIALAFLGFSLLVISLDTTVVNLALPSISNELGSSASGLQWIVDAYILIFASSLLTLGSIGDRIGRKRTLQVGLIAFGLFSLGGALSTSTGMLIGMRAMMGLAGAAMMPSTLSILTATFRDPRERAQAIAMWAAVFALGSGIGPLVGGYLLEHFQWEAVFYINLPIVAIGLIGGYYFIQDSRDDHPRKVDLVGSVLSIAGLFALVYGIIEAGQTSWTEHRVLYAFGAGAVLLGFFALSEWRSPEPMLPLRFFKNMSFTGANMALTLISFAMFGIMFFMSQFFQTVQGYSALQAGVRLLPMAGMSFVAAVMSARVAQRVGTKVAVGTGILTSATGLFYLSQIAEVDTSYSTIVLVMCIISTGMGLTMSPATNSIMGSLPVNKAGVGSAMNDTTRMLGGALGVAVLGTIMNNLYITKIDATLGATLSSSPQLLDAARSSIQGAHIAAQQIQSINPTLAGMIVQSANQAFMDGMVRAVMIAGIIMVVASVVTFVILPMRVRPAKEDPQTTSIPVTVKGTSLAPVLQTAEEDKDH